MIGLWCEGDQLFILIIVIFHVLILFKCKHFFKKSLLKCEFSSTPDFTWFKDPHTNSILKVNIIKIKSTTSKFNGTFWTGIDSVTVSQTRRIIWINKRIAAQLLESRLHLKHFFTPRTQFGWFRKCEMEFVFYLSRRIIGLLL